jgi:diguanylate cyclase (GGDEF)-like protein
VRTSAALICDALSGALRRYPGYSAVQLISRRDAGLATSLIVGMFVLFNRPLESLFDLAASVDRMYGLALVPALTVLAATLAFHQYQRRREIAEEARQALVRTQEVERLLRMGRALAESIDAEALRKALYRLLPTFSGERLCWLLRWQDQQWLEFLGDGSDSPFETMEQAPARLTQPGSDGQPAEATSIAIGEIMCFPLVAGARTVGVLGVSNRPSLSSAEQGAIAAMAALVALALRNLDVLDESRRRAIRDELTGCTTRTYGLERLQVELRRACRTGRPVSILLFDIDGFKAVNDSFGHLTGDLVLQSVGSSVRQLVRTSDVCCRIGGDEFLVVLPDTPAQGALVVAEKLRGKVSSLRLQHPGPPAISISVGYVTAEHGETDGLSLVHKADQALYAAKRAGRNRVSGVVVDDAPVPAEHQPVEAVS